MPAGLDSADPNRDIRHALLVIGGGVCAALHVGKLPPALTVLREVMGLSLVEAGFLLSMVQLAGMALGLVFGAMVDSVGHARSMRLGLGVLAAASVSAAFVNQPAAMLALRAAEGLGLLMTVLAAPAWVRALVRPSHLKMMMALWGIYMPLGMALALLLGSAWIDAWGWRSWWVAVGGLTALVGALIAMMVPSAPPTISAEEPSATLPDVAARFLRASFRERVRETLSHRGPWLVAVCFAAYSSQWLAVIGFLPTIYTQARLSAASAGTMTALVCLVNMGGSMLGARLLHRGAMAPRLIMVGFGVMALGCFIAFVETPSGPLPLPLRFVAITMFSLIGGLVPSSLFGLAVHLAPSEGSVASTVGWMQQWSALGQFSGPPLVAWLASAAGGWQLTWVACGTLSLAGIVLAMLIARHPRQQHHRRGSIH